MEKNETARYIIGASIDPDPSQHPDGLLAGIGLAFGYFGSGNLTEADSMDAYIFRQGDVFEERSLGKATLITCATDHLTRIIDAYEAGVEIPLKVGGEDAAVIYVLGLGDTPFCQAFIHFMAMTRERVVNSWALHYVRRLTDADIGKTIWYDTGMPDDYYENTMQEMITEFTERMRAA